MVAICHNMDLGDAWEWSDDARYYEKWASLAYRIAVDYFVYDLTMRVSEAADGEDAVRQVLVFAGALAEATAAPEH